MSDSHLTFPAVACKKCGSIEKNSEGKCRLCRNADAARYRARNREKSHAATNAWQKRNPEKIKANNAAWRERNTERATAYAAAWRKANAERYRTAGAAWRVANAEKLRAQRAEWRAANKDAVTTYHRNRRARKAEAGGVLSKGLSERLFKLQKGKCACCGKPLGKTSQLDHILPLSKGGANTDDNMQLLRKKCNLQKSAKDPIDFMQERGFLL